MSGVNLGDIGKPGRVSFFARNTSTAPTGWLICNGQAVSRSTYSALFSVIGTVFGAGDGLYTFNVPDLRGEFIRCWTSTTQTYDNGRTFGSFQDHAIVSHSHLIDVNRNLFYAGGGGRANDSPSTDNVYTGTAGAIDRTATSYLGGTETRPSNIALIACILAGP